MSYDPDRHAVISDYEDTIDLLKKELHEKVQTIATLTAERDSETRWAKQYCDEMVNAQAAAAHLEKVMNSMKVGYDKCAAALDAAQTELAQARVEIAKLRQLIPPPLKPSDGYTTGTALAGRGGKA